MLPPSFVVVKVPGRARLPAAAETLECTGPEAGLVEDSSQSPCRHPRQMGDGQDRRGILYRSSPAA